MYHCNNLYILTDVFQSGSTTNSAPSSHSVLSLRVWPRSTKVIDVSKSVSTMYFRLSVQFTSPHFCHRQYTYIFSMSYVSQSGSTTCFISSVQFTTPRFSHRQYTYKFSTIDVSQFGSTIYSIRSVQFTSPHFSTASYHRVLQIHPLQSDTHHWC